MFLDAGPTSTIDDKSLGSRPTRCRSSLPASLCNAARRRLPCTRLRCWLLAKCATPRRYEYMQVDARLPSCRSLTPYSLRCCTLQTPYRLVRVLVNNALLKNTRVSTAGRTVADSIVKDYWALVLFEVLLTPAADLAGRHCLCSHMQKTHSLQRSGAEALHKCLCSSTETMFNDD